MTPWKAAERLGRRFLVRLLAALLRRRPAAVHLPACPRVLVVRLDERLGNLLLLTPLLGSLRRSLPQARIDVLVHRRGAQVLGGHPWVDGVHAFDKRALLAAEGPLRGVFALRRWCYDLCLDAGNPTDPSVTQALLTRLCGATHSVGAAQGPFAALYSAPVRVPPGHEVDMRLALLRALPGATCVRRLYLPAPRVDASVAAGLQGQRDRPQVVVNLGARLADKRLDVATYAALVAAVRQGGAQVLLTYGPKERRLAEAVSQLSGAELAPPTEVAELAALMAAARGVVSTDTGPMHLAVALGTPTCGIFVSTDPQRFGHAESPHCVVDARQRAVQAWLPEVAAFSARAASGVVP